MRDFYTHNELDFYQQTRTPLGMLAVIAVKFFHLWMFYLGLLLTLPLVMVIATLPMGFSWRSLSRETRFLLGVAVTYFGGLAMEVFFFPHYAAPLTCVILALLLLALRRLRQWQWHGQPAGQFMTRAVPLGCALLLLVRWGAGPLRLPLASDWPPTWYNAKWSRRAGRGCWPSCERYPKSNSSSYDSSRAPSRCTTGYTTPPISTVPRWFGPGTWAEVAIKS